jgi:hypothetical protein
MRVENPGSLSGGRSIADQDSAKRNGRPRRPASGVDVVETLVFGPIRAAGEAWVASLFGPTLDPIINGPIDFLFGRGLIGNGGAGTPINPNGGAGGFIFGDGGVGYTAVGAATSMDGVTAGMPG